MNILAVNAGSSSLKCALYPIEDGLLASDPAQPLWQAHARWSEFPGTATIRVQTTRGDSHEENLQAGSAGDLLAPLIRSVLQGHFEIAAVGHRVVHGGQEFRRSTQITPAVKDAIARLGELAPAHNRVELELVEAVGRLLGSAAPQIAVFDTAFHATLPPAAYTYSGPHGWLDQGIRKFGFHGISHQYTVRRATVMLASATHPLRLISCHLGSGCSLAAIQNGESVDTTMGFTPLAGLMMGTRSGSVDPGILIYLMRHHGYSADQIDRQLNRESGLLGLSGISPDIRQIVAAMHEGNDRARLAFDVFVHSVRSHIGAMLASLDGLDALIFTGGVGENSAEVRAATCERMAHLGIKLDAEKNVPSSEDRDISASGSPVRILVIHTREEWEIAGECAQVLGARGDS